MSDERCVNFDWCWFSVAECRNDAESNWAVHALLGKVLAEMVLVIRNNRTVVIEVENRSGVCNSPSEVSNLKNGLHLTMPSPTGCGMPFWAKRWLDMGAG